MSCFTRLFHRTSGFNPASSTQQKTQVTITNQNGRYIKNEEDPIVTVSPLSSTVNVIPRETQSHPNTKYSPTQTQYQYTNTNTNTNTNTINKLNLENGNLTAHLQNSYYPPREPKQNAPTIPKAKQQMSQINSNDHNAIATKTTNNLRLKRTVEPPKLLPLEFSSPPTRTPPDIAELREILPKRPQQNAQSMTPVYLEELKQKQNGRMFSYEASTSSGVGNKTSLISTKSNNFEKKRKPKIDTINATTTNDPNAIEIEKKELKMEMLPTDKAITQLLHKTQSQSHSELQISLNKRNTTLNKTKPTKTTSTKSFANHPKKKTPKESLDVTVGDRHDSGIGEQRESTESATEPVTTELNPPASVQGRKEGLIFDRPKLSNEKEESVEIYSKDIETRFLIRTAIEKNDFLNNYMDAERKERVIDVMEPVQYSIGSFIINENEEGSEIYVSETGNFNVIKDGEVISTFGPGIVFGELAILYNAKRFASIKAATNTKVWKIDRAKFRTIMLISGSKEKQENLKFLRSAPLLKDLPDEYHQKIVDLLKRKFYPANWCIVRQGDVGNDFYIIRGGTVTIKKINEHGIEKVVDIRKRGQFFGEQALLNADKRQASVYADAPGTECLKLDREAFHSYIGSTIPGMKKKPIDKDIVQPYKRSSNPNSKYDHIKMVDLSTVATLGAGAFGRVDLVKHKTGETFALKVIKKIEVLRQNQIDHIYSEKQVMTNCRNSPFIVELYKTFRDAKYVYFLMEACLGGDVWTVMYQKKFFDEKSARFIVACVVEAFDNLHAKNIIFRDLKPENLMLTPDGYCKLVDFGFAKRLSANSKTNTFAGTPEYVAPEIILDRGHDRAVDYWALGILIYELLVGKTPFRGHNQMKIYQLILGGIDAVKMPSKIPKSVQGLIKHLCKQMPAERLGYQKKGIMEIKKHSWFDGFDWHKLRMKQLNSPIKRPINNNEDIQHFTPCAEDTDVPIDETSGWDENF